jgi:uncharacterized protein (DUF433 family)
VQLEDYFEFEKFSTKHGDVERIRIKGRRIAIEHVLYYYREEGMGPEQIAREVYTDLPLEAVYATILYYLHNKEAVEAYLERGEQIADAWYQDYLKEEPPFVVKRLQDMRAAQQAQNPSHE